MSLSQKIKDQSLQTLISHYSPKKLTLEGRERLKALNTLAAVNGVALSMQSAAVINLIYKQLENSFPKSSRPDVVASIYSLVIEQMDRETYENKRKHQAQGSFERKNIHQRKLHDQLQDHDMNLLMPKSHGDIEVLAPVNRFDTSIDAVREGITAALKNKEINHVVIPIGPGHWRGIYLTKPVDAKGIYQLELFDPYGPNGATAIKQMTLDLLAKCGIQKTHIAIKETGPTHPQQDGYACGDFTCAHSHKKMKEFGAKSMAYNQELITALEGDGNKKDSLRHTSRKVTTALNTPVILSKVVEKPLENKLTPQEENILTTTISAQKNPSVAYKQEIASLIKNRHSIFAQANTARYKEEKAQPLSDKELATKLQAEELSNAGFKPSSS
ncbi:MAG: hypothetical protein P4L65_10500 [Legionella sp.]|nr:hypothetical protein [Legionella sp.]